MTTTPPDQLPDALRALMDKSAVALSVADGEAEDLPLIGVNRAFEDLSGYSEAEVLGRNCRFLQPEGGAGPVRERMRAFLADETEPAAKFVIPNVRKSGEPFLNLVYMARLKAQGGTRYILGSQFDATRGRPDGLKIYEEALREDIRRLNRLTNDSSAALLGSYDALASSQALIAQARL